MAANTRDISMGRGNAGTPIQISGPIVAVGTRFDEDEARRTRHRLYHEGLGRTAANESRRARASMESDANSEEMWPGTY